MNEAYKDQDYTNWLDIPFFHGYFASALSSKVSATNVKILANTVALTHAMQMRDFTSGKLSKKPSSKQAYAQMFVTNIIKRVDNGEESDDWLELFILGHDYKEKIRQPGTKEIDITDGLIDEDYLNEAALEFIRTNSTSLNRTPQQLVTQLLRARQQQQILHRNKHRAQQQFIRVSFLARFFSFLFTGFNRSLAGLLGIRMPRRQRLISVPQLLRVVQRIVRFILPKISLTKTATASRVEVKGGKVGQQTVNNKPRTEELGQRTGQDNQVSHTEKLRASMQRSQGEGINEPNKALQRSITEKSNEINELKKASTEQSKPSVVLPKQGERSAYKDLLKAGLNRESQKLATPREDGATLKGRGPNETGRSEAMPQPTFVRLPTSASSSPRQGEGGTDMVRANFIRDLMRVLSRSDSAARNKDVPATDTQRTGRAPEHSNRETHTQRTGRAPEPRSNASAQPTVGANSIANMLRNLDRMLLSQMERRNEALLRRSAPEPDIRNQENLRSHQPRTQETNTEPSSAAPTTTTSQSTTPDLNKIRQNMAQAVAMDLPQELAIQVGKVQEVTSVNPERVYINPGQSAIAAMVKTAAEIVVDVASGQVVGGVVAIEVATGAIVSPDKTPGNILSSSQTSASHVDRLKQQSDGGEYRGIV